MRFFSRVVSFTIEFLNLFKERISNVCASGTYIPLLYSRPQFSAQLAAIDCIGLALLLFAHCRHIARINHDVADPKFCQPLVCSEPAESGLVNRVVTHYRIICYQKLAQPFRLRQLAKFLQYSIFGQNRHRPTFLVDIGRASSYGVIVIDKKILPSGKTFLSLRAF